MENVIWIAIIGSFTMFTITIIGAKIMTRTKDPKKTTNSFINVIVFLFLAFIISMLFLVSGCCEKEEVIPDPCEIYPDPPYSDPDRISTYTEESFKTITYTYECLDTEFVIVSYIQNHNVLKEGKCWVKKVTRHPDGICD